MRRKTEQEETKIVVSACSVLFIIYYLLFIIYYLLFVIYYLLFIIYYLLFIIYCLLFIIYCLLFIIYCLLFIIYYLLFIVYYLFPYPLSSDCFLKGDGELVRTACAFRATLNALETGNNVFCLLAFDQ